jgi:3-deoxy-manno-octulosonate cytidylyltransferase (CMP-KDO synthetase)
MTTRVVIPARYASERLPGKPLVDIAGWPMIRHVWARAVESEAGEVLVATDDERIAAACAGFGAEAEMTSADHVSGTDRIAEIADRRGWDEDDIVVNVQGDEPLIPPRTIRQVAELLQGRPEADMATLCTPIHALDDFLDPNVVKLVMREDGAALYFSRAPIPWHRDGAAAGIASQTRFAESLRHLGIYAYRCRALSALSAAAPCPLEHAERLEQLRAMWLGMTILAAVAVEVPGHGVDTPAQLEAVRERLAGARARG